MWIQFFTLKTILAVIWIIAYIVWSFFSIKGIIKKEGCNGNWPVNSEVWAMVSGITFLIISIGAWAGEFD